jgi:hypothetical protein
MVTSFEDKVVKNYFWGLKDGTNVLENNCFSLNCSSFDVR